MPEFRPQQQLALDYPGNVAVSAGAGSGKTRILVEKYFRLLADEHTDWPLNSVVAVTFTIKAASELRKRIVERIREEVVLPNLSQERAARLGEMRRHIAEAPIGTIHNFCARLLREFSDEAGISPDFAILEGPRERALRIAAVETVLTEIAASPDSPGYRDLLSLLSVYSRRQLSGLLETMLVRRSEFIGIAERYQAMTLDALFEELQAAQAEQSARRRGEIIATVSEIAVEARESGKLASWQGLADFVAELETVRAKRGDWSQVCGMLERLKSSLFTLKGDLRKKAEAALGLNDADSFVARIRKVCTDGNAPGLRDLGDPDRENLEISRMIAGLFLQTVAVHARARSAADSELEIDLVDFTDLETKAELLLSKSPHVRNRLREAIRYMIVDEFQDTSEAQWRILGAVVCDDGGRMLPSRFFMVGDPKQGIYGFRRAGGGIFPRVEKLVESSNRHAGLEGNGLVSVSENFRTLSGPLTFVNELFAGLMPDNPESEHEVGFRPLRLARQGGEGSVEVLIAANSPATVTLDEPVDSDENKSESADEAKMTAGVIADVTSDGRAQYGDIAILFRKRRHFTDYEQALRERGIPFVTHRGKGLYEQPEICDLLALLRLINSPMNDLNALAVFRGSLFNFTDDLFVKISRMSARGFWGKCIAAAESSKLPIPLSDDENRQLSFAVSQVRWLKARAGLVSVHELLADVVARTGALAIFGATDRATQAIANIQKLLEIARNLGMADVEDFLGFAEGQADDPRGEGEATPEFLDSHAVKIMTIHAAKGLEFPIVFLAQLGDKPVASKHELLGDGRQWFAVRKTRGAKPEETYLHSWLSEIEEARSNAEEKRILYVAATRCRDHLYLCAGGDIKEGSFCSHVTKYLGGQEAGGKSRVVVSHRAPARASKTPVSGGSLHDGHFETMYSQRLRTLSGDADRKSILPPASAVEFETIPFAPVTIRPPRLLELTPAEFAHYMTCPLSFFERYVAGISPAPYQGRMTSILTNGGFTSCFSRSVIQRDVAAVFGDVKINARISFVSAEQGETLNTLIILPGNADADDWAEANTLARLELVILRQNDRERTLRKARIIAEDLSREEVVQIGEEEINELTTRAISIAKEFVCFAEPFGDGEISPGEGTIRAIVEICGRRPLPCSRGHAGVLA